MLNRLEQEYAEKGKAAQFQKLKVFLGGLPDSPGYSQLAEEMNISEGAIKVSVHRLRRRYKELLKEIIANTVDDPDQIVDEMEYLLAALRGE